MPVLSRRRSREGAASFAYIPYAGCAASCGLVLAYHGATLGHGAAAWHRSTTLGRAGQGSCSGYDAAERCPGMTVGRGGRKLRHDVATQRPGSATRRRCATAGEPRPGGFGRGSMRSYGRADGQPGCGNAGIWWLFDAWQDSAALYMTTRPRMLCCHFPFVRTSSSGIRVRRKRNVIAAFRRYV